MIKATFEANGYFLVFAALLAQHLWIKNRQEYITEYA